MVILLKETKSQKYWVAAEQSNDKICPAESIKDGIAIIRDFEREDKKDGIYERGFYSIINDENETVWQDKH